MKRAKKREDHSVKVIQCKRRPCLSIGEPPYDAEDLIRDGRLQPGHGPAQPSSDAKARGCSCGGTAQE